MEYENSNDPSTPAPFPQSVNRYPTRTLETEQSVGSRNSRCVRSTILLLVMWFLILCFVVYIAWLVINPRQPDFQLNSLSVSNINLTNLQLAASYVVKFTVNNTNKKAHVTIDDIKIDVLYGRNIVAERVLEKTDCDVGKMSHKVLRAELGMDSVHSMKSEVFKDISDDWSKKMVNFNVTMYLRISYSFGIWPSKVKLAAVACMNLAVEFVSTKGKGKLIGGEKFCPVHLL